LKATSHTIKSAFNSCRRNRRRWGRAGY